MHPEKVAIVTGGGTGIGRAVSLALAKRAAAVVILYSRSQSEALEIISKIEALAAERPLCNAMLRLRKRSGALFGAFMHLSGLSITW